MATPIDMLPTSARLVVLLVPLTSCGLLPGKKAPLRALYYEDVPNWGLPVLDAGGEPADASLSEVEVEVDASPAAVFPTSELPSIVPLPPSPIPEHCPTTLNGLSLGQQCIAGRGGCARGGLVTCAGSQLECTAVAGEPIDEECNGVDDNCDGVVDNIAPTECSAGTGYCQRKGRWQCVGGERTCEAVLGNGRVETCNGIDDDCNGQVDEQLRNQWACSAGVGACLRYSDQVCVDGKFTCMGAAAGEPKAEECNGVDDDCNGVVDDNLADRSFETCTAYVGECRRPGGFTCSSGSWVCDPSLGTDPPDNDCDGIDDDCDGETDEDFVVAPCAFGDELGACVSVGTSKCYLGNVYCSSPPPGQPSIEPQVETCNGIDDDCDGETDEDFDIGDLCFVNTGDCHGHGSIECNDQGATQCSAGPGEPITDLCFLHGNCDPDVPVLPPCSDASAPIVVWDGGVDWAE